MRIKHNLYPPSHAGMYLCMYSQGWGRAAQPRPPCSRSLPSTSRYCSISLARLSYSRSPTYFRSLTYFSITSPLPDHFISRPLGRASDLYRSSLPDWRDLLWRE